MRKEWEKNRGSKGHGMISNKNLNNFLEPKRKNRGEIEEERR